jgi:hypothetical protein
MDCIEHALGVYSGIMGHIAADMGSFSPEMADFAVNIAVAYPGQQFAAEMGVAPAKTGGRADHPASFATNGIEFTSGLGRLDAEFTRLPSSF